MTGQHLLSADDERRLDQHRGSVDEAYGAYDALRESCPVAHSDAMGGYYLLLRHGDVRRAALDWKTFSSAKGVGLPQDRTRPPLPAIEYDPPQHGAWRKLYTDAVSPSALQAMEPLVERIADDVIDAFAKRGRCDLVREFAEPLPALGICSAVGLTGKKPEQIRELALALTETVADPPAQQQAIGRLGEFILGEIHSRRQTPRDDYLTTIALAEVEGRRMNDYEMTTSMIGFLVAGHETTSSALSGLLFYALTCPELRQRLVEDDKAMGAAVEEAIASPFHGFSRTTTQEAEVGGVLIPQDQVVRLCWAAANRDPSVFPHAGQFDIDRKSNPHLGFGAGRHACAGAPFARLEMRIAFRRLLARLPDIEVTQPHLDWHFVGGMVTIPKGLAATFTPPL